MKPETIKLRDELAERAGQVPIGFSYSSESFKAGFDVGYAQGVIDEGGVVAKKLFEALRGIIEIGKRDMSNPKYDGYFDDAEKVLAEYEKNV